MYKVNDLFVKCKLWWVYREECFWY